MLFNGIVERTEFEEITLTKPEIYTKIDQLFEDVTTAINKALVEAKLISTPYEWEEVRGGGCVSDLYMKERLGISVQPKDFDMFVQAPIDALNGFDLHAVLEELDYPFTIKRYQRETLYEFMDIPFVIEFIVDNEIVEFIMCRDIKRVLDFDLSFRQFYFYKEKFYATKLALSDMKNRVIRVSCPITPISTLYRVFYMNSKYGFRIDERSFQLLEWMFKEKQCTLDEVHNFMHKKREQMREHYSFHTSMHQEAALNALNIYTNSCFTPVMTKTVTPNMLNGLMPVFDYESIQVKVKRDNLTSSQLLSLCAPKPHTTQPYIPFPFSHNYGRVELRFKDVALPLPKKWKQVYRGLSHLSSHTLNYGIEYPFGFFYKAASIHATYGSIGFYGFGAPENLSEVEDQIIQQFIIKYVNNFKPKEDENEQGKVAVA